MNKKSMLIMSAVALAVSSNMAMAAKAAPASDASSFINDLDKSFAVTSNYVFRGLSVSGSTPAVQGGVTYNHSSGLSVDFWLSSSSAGAAPAPKASNEYDITVKYTKKMKDMTVEGGLVSYSYPQVAGQGTHEFFAAVNVQNINASLHINPDSDLGDNTYIEISADIDKFNIALGVNSNDFAAADYNQVTATVALTNNLSLAVSQTDLDGDDTEWALTYEMPIK
jgi:uncharacterized protein (TIGR02001 family)